MKVNLKHSIRSSYLDGMYNRYSLKIPWSGSNPGGPDIHAPRRRRSPQLDGTTERDMLPGDVDPRSLMELLNETCSPATSIPAAWWNYWTKHSKRRCTDRVTTTRGRVTQTFQTAQHSVHHRKLTTIARCCRRSTAVCVGVPRRPTCGESNDTNSEQSRLCRSRSEPIPHRRCSLPRLRPVWLPANQQWGSDITLQNKNRPINKAVRLWYNPAEQEQTH